MVTACSHKPTPSAPALQLLFASGPISEPTGSHRLLQLVSNASCTSEQHPSVCYLLASAVSSPQHQQQQQQQGTASDLRGSLSVAVSTR